MSEPSEKMKTAAEFSKALVLKLPPDVLEHPMPFPVRLQYAAKIATEQIEARDRETAEHWIDRAASVVRSLQITRANKHEQQEIYAQTIEALKSELKAQQ